jgi:hypothetical protein
MAKHRSYSIEFERQVAQEYIAAQFPVVLARVLQGNLLELFPRLRRSHLIGTIGSWTVWASLFSRTGIGSSFAHNHILRLRWSTSQARVSFEQLGTDVSCYGFSCYGFRSSPTWFGRGAFGAVAARNSDATRTLHRRMPSLSSGNELSLLFCALIRCVA